MRTRICTALVFLCLTALPGCVYTNVGSPLDLDLDQTSLGDKVGKSSSYSLLGLVAWGDSGTRAAAENGGITILNHADQHHLVILGGVWYKQTTIVYGK
jgi:hypothetical protein